MNSNYRNKKCICGLDIKYKLCCGKYVKEDSLFDLLNKQVMNISEDGLVKRIQAFETDIEKSFDIVCKFEIKKISRYFGLARYNISSTVNQLREEKDDSSFQVKVLPVLMNLSLAISASAELIRSGYRIEPGILFRNILERISSILYLYYNFSEFDKIEKEKFESTKTITFSKKIIDIIGVCYGLLTKHNVHIGKWHFVAQELKVYSNSDKALEINIYILKTLSWLYYVVSELVCFDHIDIKKYWIKNPKLVLQYSPDENELITANNFLHNTK